MATIAQVQQIVVDTAKQYGVPVDLALAVAHAESNFNQDAVSWAGAIGVMQLMPGTAEDLGVNPYDLEQNIRGGVRYLRDQLNRFDDVALALAAYNWGPGRVEKALAAYGAQWLAHAPAETQNYVAKIAGVTATAPPASPPQEILEYEPQILSAGIPPPTAQGSIPAWIAIAGIGAVAFYTLWD